MKPIPKRISSLLRIKRFNRFSKLNVFLARGKSSGAFSLVEVVMALGICGFCVVAIMGLLPVGMNANRDTVEATPAGAIAMDVKADLLSAKSSDSTSPRYKIKLPAPGDNPSQPKSTIFLKEDGNTLESNPSKAKYRVDIAYGSSSLSGLQPIPVRILVSWPSAANTVIGTWPKNPGGRFDAVTTIEQ